MVENEGEGVGGEEDDDDWKKMGRKTSATTSATTHPCNCVDHGIFKHASGRKVWHGLAMAADRALQEAVASVRGEARKGDVAREWSLLQCYLAPNAQRLP